MNGRRTKLFLLTILVFGIRTEFLCARDPGWLGEVVATRAAPPLDLMTRKALVDHATRDAGGTENRLLSLGQLEGSEVLRLMDAESVTLGAADFPNAMVNPEPSSLLVWSVLAFGIAAAGYGCRHRAAK